MYTPQKYLKIQTDITLLKNSVRFKNFIDKNEAKNILKKSDRTVERRIKEAGLIHMKNELIDCLIQYTKGVSTKQLANLLQCSEVNINALARRHNIERPVGFNNILKSDFEFFDSIDTEEKAYILGFFAADGCITDYEMKIHLSSKDKEILWKIKKALKSEVEIRDRTNICSLTNKSVEVSMFNISSQYLVNSLKNLGFTSNKTIDCKFPPIPKEVYLYFIRGYFDGDGSFTKYLTNSSTKYCLNLCGTESFLLFIKDYLESLNLFKFNKKLTKRFNTENCCLSLNMSGKKNCIQFLNLLYKDSNIHLDRKYNKYLSFI